MLLDLQALMEPKVYSDLRGHLVTTALLDLQGKMAWQV